MDKSYHAEDSNCTSPKAALHREIASSSRCLSSAASEKEVTQGTSVKVKGCRSNSQVDKIESQCYIQDVNKVSGFENESCVLERITNEDEISAHKEDVQTKTAVKNTILTLDADPETASGLNFVARTSDSVIESESQSETFNVDQMGVKQHKEDVDGTCRTNNDEDIQILAAYEVHRDLENSRPERDNAETHSEINGERGAHEAGIVGEQHSLSGPQRRRQMTRQQRRSLAQRTGRISLPQSLMAHWRSIGVQWGLQDDNDIAGVLLRHYEDTIAGRPPRPPPQPRCQGCGEVLVPLPCNVCGPSQHTTILEHVRGNGSSEKGRNGYCGRCRD